METFQMLLIVIGTVALIDALLYGRGR